MPFFLVAILFLLLLVFGKYYPTSSSAAICTGGLLEALLGGVTCACGCVILATTDGRLCEGKGCPAVSDDPDLRDVVCFDFVRGLECGRGRSVGSDVYGIRSTFNVFVLPGTPDGTPAVITTRSPEAASPTCLTISMPCSNSCSTEVDSLAI